MVYLTINGNEDLKQPQKISVTCQDLDSPETTRSQTGLMHRERIVGGETAKRKISCKWGGLTPPEMSAIQQAIKDASFSLTYPDPYTGDFRTATVYAGDRSAPIWRNGADSIPKMLWSNLSVNFVEL